MRDESYLQDSGAFRPERFLNKVGGGRDGSAALNELANDDPSPIVFGFGRRYLMPIDSASRKLRLCAQSLPGSAFCRRKHVAWIRMSSCHL